MPIKQFTGQWASDEDRLLFRFNTADDREFRFWLTRNITRAIIESSQRVVTAALKKHFAPETAEAIQEFQQQTAIQTTQFNESYASGQNLVLGEEPVLVIGLAIQAEKEMMSIDLRLATKQNVNIKIRPPVFQKMVLLLNKLQEQARWGINLPVRTEPDVQDQANIINNPPGGRTH
jgi:hypothetical protein